MNLYIFGRKYLQTFFRKLYFFSLRGMNYNILDSGELYTIKYLKGVIKSKKPILFDVGANIGGYTEKLLKHFGEHSEIHAFEPSLQTFQKFNNRIESNSVRLNNFGLGEKKEQIKLYQPNNASTHASMYKHNDQLDYDEIDIKIETLDNYFKTAQLSKIDFLKIDVEGNDLAVLKGGKELLEKGLIDYIQFEFGGCHISARNYLKDFFEILKPNYKIYRILKDGFIELSYTEHLEIFAYANYLAVKL